MEKKKEQTGGTGPSSIGVSLIGIAGVLALYLHLNIWIPYMEGEAATIQTYGTKIAYVQNPCNYSIKDTPIYSLEGREKEQEGTASTHGRMGGSFFLGIGGVSGSIDGSGEIHQENYYYMYLEQNGGYILHKVPAMDTLVIESNEWTPAIRQVVMNDTRIPNEYVYTERILANGSLEDLTRQEINAELEKRCSPPRWDQVVAITIGETTYEEGKTYLIVPEGTIIQKMEVN